MDKDQPAPLIAETLIYEQLRRAVGDRASNGKGNLWETVMGNAVVERILRDRPAGDSVTMISSCSGVSSMRWRKAGAARGVIRTGGIR